MPPKTVEEHKKQRMPILEASNEQSINIKNVKDENVNHEMISEKKNS